MEIEYKNKYLRQICEDYRYAKKQFGEKVANATAKLMVALIMFPHIKQFATVPMLQRYRIHDLSGDKKGRKSLRIDYAYRMEIVIEIESAGTDEQDRIMIVEVSKHYGD